MKRALPAFLLALITCVATPQDSITYIHDFGYGTPYNHLTDSLRDVGSVEGAINAFQILQQQEGSAFHGFYDYACVLSIDKQIDSAFKYLRLATVLDTTALALRDPDFLNLRKDIRWHDFEKHLIASIEIKHGITYKDTAYAKRLWYMHATDQAYNDCLSISERRLGRNSTVGRALWQLKELLNQENQQELMKLVSAKGWPKYSEVGETAGGAAFLVIQHADLAKQEKYLPLIKERCMEHEADWEGYALMYDRIQTGEGKPQKYGSQLHFNKETNAYELDPLLDATKVDQWRAEVGLGPLADYVSMWGIEFMPNGK